MGEANLAIVVGLAASLTDLQEASAATCRLKRGDEERKRSGEIDEVECHRSGQKIEAEAMLEQHRPHTFEHIGGWQHPGEFLQPAGQHRYRVIHRADRSHHEADEPGKVFGAKPEAEQQRHYSKPSAQPSTIRLTKNAISGRPRLKME